MPPKAAAAKVSAPAKAAPPKAAAKQAAKAAAPAVDYEKFLDEEGNFSMTFGNADSTISLTVNVSVDETVEIEFLHGDVTDQEESELYGICEDSMELLDYDVHGFVSAVQEWLYYTTGDEHFNDNSWAAKNSARRAEVQKRKDDKARRVKEEEEKRLAKSQVARQQAMRAALVRMDFVQRQQFLRMATQARQARQQQIDQAHKAQDQEESQSKGQMTLYKVMKLERPDPAKYAGAENHFFLDSLEINFHVKWPVFNHTFCNLASVPPIIGYWIHLTELNLSYNDLVTLPTTIGSLVQLRRLILCENKLKFLPALGNLRELTLLDLRKNQMTDLPGDCFDLARLQALDLEYNHIRFLPPEIGQLTRLDYLALNNNKLAMAPPQIGQLTNLEHLKLRFNPLKVPPPEVFHQGLEATMKFLRDYIPENADIETSSIREAWHRYANNPEFSDVVIRSSEKEDLFVHKLLLFCRCRPLFEMLTSLEAASKAKETESSVEFDSEKRLVLPIQVKTDLLKLFVEFLYFDDFKREKDPRVEFDEKVLALGKNPKKDLIDVLEAQMRQKTQILVGVQNMMELASLGAQFKLPRLQALAETHYKIVTPPESKFAADFKPLYQNKQWADIELEAEGQRILVHKLVLIARSKYFHSMLGSGLKEARENFIQLSDMSFEVLQAIVEFTYTDDVYNINSDIAIDLLVASKMVGLERLRGLVESVVGYALDVENAACIYDMAKLYSCDRLEKACEYYIFGNWMAVVHTEAWRDMDPSNQQALTEQAKTLSLV